MKKTEKIIKTLNKDQIPIFDMMQKSKKLNICTPTGFGKGYIMMIDLYKRVIESDEKIFAISTHRLTLNTQHMNDLIERFRDELSRLEFVFVGSKKYNTTNIIKDILRKNKITDSELIKNVTNNKELKKLISKYKNKKFIIITTYHSLHKLRNIDVDTLYCDEAHILATASDSDSINSFKENYNKIKSTNKYFFSATPKDIVGYDVGDDLDDKFLMNNVNIFGERIGITIKEAIIGAYIPKPAIHLAVPKNYQHTDMDNVRNLSLFVQDAFISHTKKIKNDSNMPEKLAPKILVKCSNVDQMWALKTKLISYCERNDIRLFAGASRYQSTNDAKYQMNNSDLSKDKHLETLQNLGNHEKAIVLHFDTLSEGINVAGFTGVMFLSSTSPTLMKLLQNMGRALRLHQSDRVAIRNKYIDSSDYSKWIKPYAYVILPVYNLESEESQKHISETIFRLRDKGVDSTYLVSIGNDNPIPGGKEIVLPNKDQIFDVRKKLIDGIEHHIENFKEIDERDKIQDECKGFETLPEKLNFLKSFYK